MKYAKPEVALVSRAMDAIASGISKTAASQDNVHPEQGMNATSPAYEADE